MLIDCDTCTVRGPACGDCVVTVLLAAPRPRGYDSGADMPGPAPLEFDGAERAALAALAEGGLVPPLRLVPVDAPRPPARVHDPHEGRREVS